nr:hypothetical protein [Tanacetum cinerariifolium]
MISEPTVLTPVQETPFAALVITLPLPYVSTTPHLRVTQLEKDVSELKKIDLSVEALVALKTQVPSVVDTYLRSKVGDTPMVYLEQESKKSPSEILKIKKEQAKKQKMPKFTIKFIDKVALKEFDQKSALYQTMHANNSFNRNLANQRLYHALMEALIEDENAMDKGVADTEPVKEPTPEVVMDDAGEDILHDDDQPQNTIEPKTVKTPNLKWFTQPLRPPTPDLK